MADELLQTTEATPEILNPATEVEPQKIKRTRKPKTVEAAPEAEEEHKEEVVEKVDPMKARRLKDQTPIRGQFHFHEVRGGTLEFVFKQYKDDPVAKYKLRDGEITTLPLGVVRHLMTSGRYPVYKHERVLGEDAPAATVVGSWMHRYSFAPFDFVADEDIQKALGESQVASASYQR